MTIPISQMGVLRHRAVNAAQLGLGPGHESLPNTPTWSVELPHHRSGRKNPREEGFPVPPTFSQHPLGPPPRIYDLTKARPNSAEAEGARPASGRCSQPLPLPLLTPVHVCASRAPRLSHTEADHPCFYVGYCCGL